MPGIFQLSGTFLGPTVATCLVLGHAMLFAKKGEETYQNLVFISA